MLETGALLYITQKDMSKISKSPEDIVNEFIDRMILDYNEMSTAENEDVKWLRSSIASLLCYMAERIRHMYDQHSVAGMNGAVKLGNMQEGAKEAGTLLIEEARKIINNE